ncbi:HNH endonuclease [Alteromonadaceae bacterium M269]|nr:HNH endonuclease [Alteromonadaceae bacterium M269]
MANKFSTIKKTRVFTRDGEKCQYCGVALVFKDVNSWALDHVIPKSEGGSNDDSNLKLACKSCNSAKGNRDIEQYRKHCAIGKSIYAGIINSMQAEKLIDLGVVLDIPLHLFHFEAVKKASVVS